MDELTAAAQLVPTQPGEALARAEQVLGQAGDDTRVRATAQRVRGQALRALGRHADAVAAYTAAAEAATALGEPLLAAQVQVGAIDCLAMLGRFTEAETLAQTLERVFRSHDAREAAGKVLFNLGASYYRRERYSAALALYQQAAALFAQSPDADLLEAHVQTNTALVLTFLDRSDEALPLYAAARTTFLAHDRRFEAATVDANVGYLHFVSGRPVLAITELTRARDSFAAQQRHHDAARYGVDLADAYRSLNLLPEAREGYEQALALFETLPLEFERGRAELGLAALCQATGDRAGADAALTRAEAIFRAQRVLPQQAQALLLRGGVGPAERAVRLFTRAGLRGWAAEARFTAAVAQGQSRRLHAVARVARASGRHWLESRAERALGQLALQAERRMTALRHFRAGVAALEAARTQLTSEELHTAFLQDKLGIYEDLVMALVAGGRPAELTEALEQVERAKSRLLLERLLAALPDETLPAELSGLAQLRAELSRAYHQEFALESDASRRLTPVDPEKVAALEQSYRRLLRQQELGRARSVARLGTEPVPVATLQAALATDETLVEFYIAHGHVTAFVLTRERLTLVPAIAPLADITAALRRLRFHLQTAALDGRDARTDGITEVLNRLGSLLWQPLVGHLGTEKLVVIPHGSLHQVPFHALSCGRCSVLDRWELALAPSAAVWAWGRQSTMAALAAGRSALVIGVPEPGIAQVPVEVAAVASCLPGAQVLCGSAARVAAFRAAAPHARTIHLATHALFRADNPLFSGLRFDDGWLLARDLYELRLDADLVTLSACRTGVAEVAAGDELFGLVRGFLAAGARALAVSLWPADDRATAALMSSFYALLAAGKSRAAALRQAQKELREHYPHPYHWAPFYLVGER